MLFLCQMRLLQGTLMEMVHLLSDTALVGVLRFDVR